MALKQAIYTQFRITARAAMRPRPHARGSCATAVQCPAPVEAARRPQHRRRSSSEKKLAGEEDALLQHFISIVSTFGLCSFNIRFVWFQRFEQQMLHMLKPSVEYVEVKCWTWWIKMLNMVKKISNISPTKLIGPKWAFKIDPFTIWIKSPWRICFSNSRANAPCECYGDTIRMTFATFFRNILTGP